VGRNKTQGRNGKATFSIALWEKVRVCRNIARAEGGGKEGESGKIRRSWWGEDFAHGRL